ncbi:hypothetical protein GGF32_006259, partial [Allomyces javanicus]
NRDSPKQLAPPRRRPVRGRGAHFRKEPRLQPETCARLRQVHERNQGIARAWDRSV